MAFDPITAVSTLVNTVIDKVFPNAADREKAKLEFAKLELEGETKLINAKLSAIVEEAKSADKWTSRARPAFLYVIYIMILASLPMGVLDAFYPETAHMIAMGMKEWLAAIPEALWALFGAGYLGYVGGRSFDKRTIINGKK